MREFSFTSTPSYDGGGENFKENLRRSTVCRHGDELIKIPVLTSVDGQDSISESEDEAEWIKYNDIEATTATVAASAAIAEGQSVDDSQKYMMSILLEICIQLEGFISRTPNYYDIFHLPSFTIQISPLYRRLSQIILHMRPGLIKLTEYDDSMRLPNRGHEPSHLSHPFVKKGGHTSFSHGYNEDPININFNSQNPTMSLRLPLSPANVVTPPFREVTGRIFWEDHCGNASTELSWEKFLLRFAKFHGYPSQRATNQLRGALCRGARERMKREEAEQSAKANMLGKETDVPFLTTVDRRGTKAEADVVRRDDLDLFCTEYGGLYPGYLHVADPGNTVFSLGALENKKTEVGEEEEMTGLRRSNRDLSAHVSGPKLLSALAGLKVHQVSCGGEHIAAVVENGTILTWGSGQYGQLGHGKQDRVSFPTKVANLSHETCVEVGCGFAYTAAVTETGRLYTFGAGKNGRLGLGDERNRSVPKQVPMEHKVQHVYLGSVHTCLMTDAGDLYTFGQKEYTGHGIFQNLLSPKKLDAFGGEKIIQVSIGTGGYHTIALSHTNKVYTWGHNRVGQLGYSSSDNTRRNQAGAPFLPRPKIVKSLEPLQVKQVAAGWGHSAIITHDGRMYTCGRNLHGQLGIGPCASMKKNERGHPYQDTFMEVSTLSQKFISQIALGGEHSLAIEKDGSVYMFGKILKDQLGYASDVQTIPQKLYSPYLNEQQTLQISCGINYNLFLCQKKEKCPSLFNLSRDAVVNLVALEDIQLDLVDPTLLEILNIDGTTRHWTNNKLQHFK